MNTETGRIYEGRVAIEAAETRGEPLVEVTPGFARRARRAKKAGRYSQRQGQALAELARTRPDLSLPQRERLVEGLL